MKKYLPILAITALAALALVGCNQNSPGDSIETPSPNSSMSHDNGMMGGTTNMMTTNNMPHINTNLPASTHQ